MLEAILPTVVIAGLAGGLFWAHTKVVTKQHDTHTQQINALLARLGAVVVPDTPEFDEKESEDRYIIDERGAKWEDVGTLEEYLESDA